VRYIFESRILLLLAYDACLIWSGGGDSGEGGDDGREAAVPRVRAAGGGASAGTGPHRLSAVASQIGQDWTSTHREDIWPERTEI